MKKPRPPLGKTALNAAAIQDHLLRSMGLKGAQRRPSSLTALGRNIITEQPANYYTTKPEPHSRQIEKQHQAYKNRLTLAQRLGIVDKPAAPLTNEEWTQVESLAAHRQVHKHSCPICMEAFKGYASVILSCAHVFHAQCLNSFERHAAQRVCPICRKRDYDKKQFVGTQLYYIEASAVKLQSWFRGHLARVKFAEIRRLHPPQHYLVKRKYYGKQLAELGNQLTDEVERRSKEIDALFAEFDRQQETTKQVLDNLPWRKPKSPKAPQPVAKLTPLEERRWSRAKSLAQKRHETECPICIQEFGGGRALCILSCSHVFHSRCVEAFERYSVRADPCCPVCRQKYEKTQFEFQG
mmetsp:Transcript_15738/g.28763  ORF Transcript_15738/g.28763 Transcript_15738/m.28763 type:complete len:353 (+) Transcript_15738:1397-2455(+)